MLFILSLFLILFSTLIPVWVLLSFADSQIWTRSRIPLSVVWPLCGCKQVMSACVYVCVCTINMWGLTLELMHNFCSCHSPEVYRLNLEQGRFLNSFTTKSRYYDNIGCGRKEREGCWSLTAITFISVCKFVPQWLQCLSVEFRASASCYWHWRGWEKYIMSTILTLLACVCCTQGTVECWDPRSHSRVGELSLAATGIEFSDRYI